jgi:hypothetical protein
MLEFFTFLRKAWFIVNRVRISLTTLEQLIRFDITIEIYDIDKMENLTGLVRFIPIQRCKSDTINEKLFARGIHIEPNSEIKRVDELPE